MYKVCTLIEWIGNGLAIDSMQRELKMVIKKVGMGIGKVPLSVRTWVGCGMDWTSV